MGVVESGMSKKPLPSGYNIPWNYIFCKLFGNNLGIIGRPTVFGGKEESLQRFSEI